MVQIKATEKDDLIAVSASEPASDQAVRAGSNSLLQALDVYWRAPKSSHLRYTSRQVKRSDRAAGVSGPESAYADHDMGATERERQAS